jgi:hypothetical protein
VDVRLEGELPSGARPDLSVDGTIELERLNDVVYVGRPVFGQPHSTITLFRLEPDGREALRVQVRLGSGDFVGHDGSGCPQPHPAELSVTP